MRNSLILAFLCKSVLFMTPVQSMACDLSTLQTVGESQTSESPFMKILFTFISGANQSCFLIISKLRIIVLMKTGGPK